MTAFYYPPSELILEKALLCTLLAPGDAAPIDEKMNFTAKMLSARYFARKNAARPAYDLPPHYKHRYRSCDALTLI